MKIIRYEILFTQFQVFKEGVFCRSTISEDLVTFDVIDPSFIFLKLIKLINDVFINF